jgi:CHAT domain-containing protein/tetratricopeptide (TPR) repeat protein
MLYRKSIAPISICSKVSCNWKLVIAAAIISLLVSPQGISAQTLEQHYQAGQAAYNAGKYDEAIANYQEALRLDSTDQNSYIGLGASFYQKKDFQEAETVYRTLLSINPDNAFPYILLGDVLLGQKKFEEAVDAYRKAYQYFPSDNYVKQKLEEAISAQSQITYSNNQASEQSALELFNLGVIASDSKNYDQAIEYYQRALGSIQSEQPVAIAIFDNLVHIYLKLDRYKDTAETSRRWISYLETHSRGMSSSQAKVFLGIALAHLGEFPESEISLRDGINEVSQTWQFYGREDDASSPLFEDVTEAYRALQKALVGQGKLEEALEVAEKGRSRNLVDVLIRRFFREGYDIQQSPYSGKMSSGGTVAERVFPVPYLTVNEMKEVAKAQNATIVYYSIISNPKPQNSELYAWVIAPSGEITFRRQPFPSSIQTSIAEFVKDTRAGIVATRSGESIQASGLTVQIGDFVRLQDHENDPRLQPYSVVAINKNTRMITLSDPVSDWRTSISIDKVKEVVASQAIAHPNLQKLHQLLIAPIQDKLPTSPEEQVIFVPQDELSAVPFAALQDEAQKFLIEKHTISTAPALQVLELMNRRKQQVQGKASDILVVGNPSMPTVPGQSRPLSPLPNSEKEAITIGQTWGVDPLIGQQANKADVLSKIAHARIIHLATHSVLNDKNGILSSIALAPSGNDNGLLNAQDIFKFSTQLNAELVVMSACNTGQGSSSTDGIIGLSRSMIAIGVPSVIVSLWSVPDAPTADLMTEFHRQLKANPNKAQALRQAMLETMKTKPNPVDWSAFTLMGQP